MEPELEASHRSKLDQIFHVEYVILYRFQDGDQAEAIHQFKRLIKALDYIGLETAVRPAGEGTLFVFVKAREDSLNKAIHRGRVRDWLYGVRQIQPGSDEEGTKQEPTEAERLRIIYDMITWPRTDGGVGITPKYGDWKHVEAVFPLHDKDVNKEWIMDWSRKTLLSRHDLDQIRARLGERVAFYFTFLQAYFTFLIFPAAFGVACWALLGQFSVVYAVVNSLACLVFVEFWKRQEVDLKLRWQVKGVSAIKAKRRQFKHDKEVIDSVTGEKILVFSTRTRLLRQLLQVPFALAAVLALGTLIAFCFGIEIFISEIYSGPFKAYLAFIPTVILSLMVPTISGILTKIATELTDYENYETQDGYDVALTQKIFVLNFITSYLPVFLTAFVYVPFAQKIVPYLDVFHVAAPQLVSKEGRARVAEFQIDRSRLRRQVIYFTVTAQIVNFGLEAVMPHVKRRVLNKYNEMQAEKKENHSKQESGPMQDAPAEADFLARVRKESELSEYDVTTDLREMCVQFGYLSLFSPVWPLVPLSFLINNWIELRSDFVKICIECRRPAPVRSDTIGPWLDSLGFLAWLGSITSAALVYMFSDGETGPDGGPSQIKGWALLLTIFFSEHLYLLARLGVQIAFSKIDTPETRHERGQRYRVRKAYLDTILPEQDGAAEAAEEGREDNAESAVGGEEGAQRITRESLEEDARRLSQHSASAADMFWARQRGWKECAQVGVSLIQAGYTASLKEKKSQ
ncbi:hypothetical protein D8B26_004887 [Coccidioides posadasii str. Silveira]|uniref:Plasma membrane channel protein Aqy1 n=1 Tax=Coccidioides posadasii (strain RMSCC 757 / Silveira) TaxID=443226 RepID=E9D696_COCPS|nr:plasma membrane channel protein Aqy1 [Coccidioides posadasii str. Silveira]QVM10226.1 hypothetical protein D8B26_004887 [Coccidioides posadasii str. Silveira]